MKIIAVLLLFGAVASAQPGTDKTSEISDADEVRAGQALAARFVELEGLAPTPQVTAIEKYLQSVVDRLGAHAQRKLPYRVHFDSDPGFKSAFALPGGEIFIGAGSIAMMDTEDQLAIVLGHEMEHVAQNQCRNRLITELASQHLTMATIEQMKVEPFLPGYGHEKEFAADREGVKLAAATGYSPKAASRLLNMYVILGQQMTHTPSEAEKNLKDRIAQVEKLIIDEKLATPTEKPLGLP